MKKVTQAFALPISEAAPIGGLIDLPEMPAGFRHFLGTPKPSQRFFMTVPERYTQIKFVAQDIDTIVVRLPPKFAIEDSEERLSQPGATYPVPPFYKRLFNGIDPVIPENEKFKVHAGRIGDYTISFCA